MLFESYKKRLMYQCRKPKGIYGKFIARRMNKSHANLATWGLNFIKIEPNYIILDIGCGGGINIHNFAPLLKGGKVYGIDYSDISVEISNKLNKRFIDAGKVSVQKASVSKIPFPDNFFDLVTGFETCYFWPDIITDLKEVLRVLKPDGRVLLVNEGFKCENPRLRERNEYWSKLGDFPIYAPQEFRSFFEKAGFSKIEIEIEQQQEYIAIIGVKD